MYFLILAVVSAVEECDYTKSGDCSADLLTGTSTKITVLNSGGCWTTETGPFAFQVWPGDSKKVVIAFRGSRTTTYEAAVAAAIRDEIDFSPEILPDDPDGLFSRTSYFNPFQTCTTIMIPQCTADAHLGNQAVSYVGAEVQHFGAINVESVLNWIDENHLCSEIEQLTLIGLSSGSIGATLFAKNITQRCNPSGAQTTLVLDASPSSLLLENDPNSCLGLFLNTQLLQKVNGCSFLPGVLETKCSNGDAVDAVDIVTAVIDDLGPGVLIQEITVKFDQFVVQLLNDLVGVAALEEKSRIFPAVCSTFSLNIKTEEQWYKAVVNFHKALSDAFPSQYVSYIIDADYHVSTDTATALTDLGQFTVLPNVPLNASDPFSAPNPFASEIFNAEFFFGTTTQILPTFYETTSACGQDLCYYEPSAPSGLALLSWLGAPYGLPRFPFFGQVLQVCNECDGSLVPSSTFTGLRNTCNADLRGCFQPSSPPGGGEGNSPSSDDKPGIFLLSFFHPSRRRPSPQRRSQRTR